MSNRKLLVSVQTPQECREAIIGGARILDCEDPRTALGNISPLNIMQIAQTALDFKTGLEVQLSTNIGEDQLLFRRARSGLAVRKSRKEMAGKAAQAALGVAASLGTSVHPSGLVKVGVDGMDAEDAQAVLREVVTTLRASDDYSNARVMAVFFAHDLTKWDERKHELKVRQTLVEVGEFASIHGGIGGADGSGAARDDKDSFSLLEPDIRPHLRDGNGDPIFDKAGGPAAPDATLVELLVQRRVLPAGVPDARVRLNEPFSHAILLGHAQGPRKTSREVIQKMVECAAGAGVDAIMIDTSILMKSANLCLFDTTPGSANQVGGVRVADINRFVDANTLLQQHGVLTLEELKFFVEYAHFKGLAANVAGSIASYHAQQLWALIPDLDQLSTRGAASAVVADPADASGATKTADTRMARIIKRTLVQGMVPPEQAGVLNLPEAVVDDPNAKGELQHLVQLLHRHAQQPPVYSLTPQGVQRALNPRFQ